MFKNLLIGIATLAVGAAIAVPAFTSNTQHSTFESFEKYNAAYNEIVSTYDLEAFTQLYNAHPVWIDPNKAPVSGLTVPRQTLQFLAANEGLLSHTLEEVYMSDDGTQAVITGEYNLEIEKFSKKGKGTYLFVLKREGETWKIAVDMFNEHVES